MKTLQLAPFIAALLLTLPVRAGVKLSRTPDDGIQPKTIVDGRGITHLLTFRGEAGGGDLFYSTRGKSGGDFGKAAHINSQPKSAVSAGTIRGGQFALGKGGVVHVVWNGSRTKNGENAPLFYTRSTSGGVFETQRAMSGDWIMDGGGAVAADANGHVYVLYHGGLGKGEDNRRVLMRASSDSGETFGPETIISPDGMGVCACCSMQAFADSRGRLFVIYRAAADGGRNRDVTALFSDNQGRTWSHSTVGRWPVAACPMSSMTIAQVNERIWMAWEKEGQVFIGEWDDGAKTIVNPVAMPGAAAGRKHPVIAVSPDSKHALVAWTEGTGWKRGGSVGWQMLDSNLRPSGGPGHASGVAVWSFVSAVPLEAGSFEILH